jgi:DNA-binding LytR/AlgR family response regulator
MSARALIAEDEALLRGEIREAIAELWPELSICAEVGDGSEASLALQQHAPDILFLDIQMPGLTGLQLAEQASGRAHVVFITAFDRYAVDAFEQGALDYLLKPISRERLARTVERLKERLHSVPADLRGLVDSLRKAVTGRDNYLQWITVTQGQDLKLITVGEICYFRTDSKYTAVVTADSEHLISRPLKTLVDELDPRLFWRIHRGVVVNVNAIRSVHRDFRGRLEVRLKCREEVLPVSEAHAHLFRRL